MSERGTESMAPAPAPARLSVDQFHRMIEAGILREGDPIELLDGLIVYKNRSARGEDPMTTGKRHALAVKLLAELDPACRRIGSHMQTQMPVSLPPNHEPEPDGAIVRGVPRDYVDRLPEARDVSCVIEVGDSSLETDRTRRLAAFAHAGIPQYVIVNLVDRQVEVHEEPVPVEGRYARVAIHAADAAVSLQAHSGRVDVIGRDLLP